MMRTLPNRKRRVQRRVGAAVAEFAVVAPLFLMIVFGMFEFGRAIMVHQVLVNASREGARIAVLDGATIAQVEAQVDSFLAASGVVNEQVIYTLNGTEVSDPTGANSGFGDAVGVEVRVAFNDVSWLPVPQYIGGQTLSALCVMRRETYQ